LAIGNNQLNTTISNLVVKGIATGPSVTGSGIKVTTSANLGPGLLIDGALYGVYGGGLLSGSATQPTRITNMSERCVQGGSGITSIPPGSQNVILADCNGATVFGTVDGALITNAASSKSVIGLSGPNIVKNTTISDFVGTGLTNLSATGSPFTAYIAGNVTVKNIIGNGVITNSAMLVSIDGLTSKSNQGDGLRILGVAKVRNSTFVGNAGNGVLLLNSSADFGDNGDTGNNIFNETSVKNGTSGLCLLPVVAATYNITGGTFSCGYSGAGCMTGMPTSASGATCQTGLDITANSAATVNLPSPSPSCCN
jgi:hypothetical protein